MIADLSIANSFGVAGLRDLKLYFSPAGSVSATSVASFNPIAARGSVLLADAVSTIYGQTSRSGSIQVRTADANRILVGARLLTAKRARGTVGTMLPVFRSSRAALPGESLAIAGLGREPPSRTS